MKGFLVNALQLQIRVLSHLPSLNGLLSRAEKSFFPRHKKRAEKFAEKSFGGTRRDKGSLRPGVHKKSKTRRV